MDKQIIWTQKAEYELVDILRYWIDRNKSSTFSVKLNLLIEKELNLVSKFPGIGRPTDVANVRVKVIQNYLLYYEIIDDSLYVLTIRHQSRNPNTLKLR